MANAFGYPSPRRHDAALFSLLLAAFPFACCFSTVPNKNVIQTYSIGEVECMELRSPQKEKEEDAVDTWYPTKRRMFAFPSPHRGKNITLTVRETSYGCGKLGFQLWPSGMALALYLVAHRQEFVQDQRVLELGAGIGFLSMVCRDVLGADSVLATDFWQNDGEAFDKNRLVPTKYHAMNLQYNVENEEKRASVKRLDWYDLDETRETKNAFAPDLIVGSDIVYYPVDLQPLLNTLKVLLKEDKTSTCAPSRAILMTPLGENERDALPEFRKRLPKEFEPSHTVEMEEVVVNYKKYSEQASFLMIHIRPRPHEK